jgi:hypothetical protein
LITGRKAALPLRKIYLEIKGASEENNGRLMKIEEYTHEKKTHSREWLWRGNIITPDHTKGVRQPKTAVGRRKKYYT